MLGELQSGSWVLFARFENNGLMANDYWQR